MRSASLHTLAFVLISTLAACAGSEAEPATEESPTEPTSGPTTIPADPDAGGSSSAAAPVCAPTCATDDDCSKTCPAVAGAVQCCDLASKTCFASKSATCPKPASDAGTAPAY